METETLFRGFSLAIAGLALGVQAANATEAPTDIPTVEVPHQVSLVAIADADVQGGAPDQNYGSHTVMHIGNTDKTVFVYFDLSSVPEGATVTDARLVMTVAGAGSGPNEVKLGAARGPWREPRITYANQPQTAWSNRLRNVSGAGPMQWNVKEPVKQWVSGDRRNHGFAIRSTGQGPIWAFTSREGAPADSRPTLHVAYTTTGGVYEPPLAGSVSGSRKKGDR